MRKEIRSAACICVFAVGAGLFSAALAVMSGFVADAVASETARVLQSQAVSAGHLIAAIAIVMLSVSALRALRGADAQRQRVQVRPPRDEEAEIADHFRDLPNY